MLGWVRVAAGEHFPELEIHAVKVTDERRQGAAQLAAELVSWPATVVSNAALSTEPILASARFLISTIEQIVVDVQERRERYGITYLTVFGEHVDTFSPVVACWPCQANRLVQADRRTHLGGGIPNDM